MRTVLFVLATSLVATPALAAPILGGTPATAGQFPNVVLIQTGQGLCTGTLITKDWVLTAAHCVTPSVVGEPSQAALTASVRVHFGTVNGNTMPGTVVMASDTIPDPGFSPQNLGSHDSGLIKLSTPVTNITPVPINFVAADAPVGVQVTMVGFGATAVGGGGNVGVEMVVGQTSTSCATFSAGSDADLLCYSQTGGKGKCEGDSGGPSFSMQDGHLLEVGITSFGDNSCAQFGADTRVDAEKAFILQHVPELSCGMDGTCNPACGMGALPVDPDCPVCQVDADCMSADKVCFNHQCVLGPSVPMGLGSTCMVAADCQSGSCGTGPDGKRCVDGCTVGTAASCPSNFDCLGSTGTGGACWPSADSGNSGGCDASGGGAPVMLLGVVLLGLVVRRPRA